ncbi:4-(cytidine 5'-diphospho)-2-C-methyl-D-erythritol kinase [Ligilactobacillus sp. Marseille-Q7487]|jgi:4-diphosphocytidyl-2-C-methyl-D-erythritol kinase|uniref:4-(cytidine 5'-diphospho)-2-C-methyl-D-erythritol kinase n=1 Tax=Ligilactobacillus sp. Marseille-Q7487 TaxID=3022128 RepID=UPI0015B6D6F5|nr:4-(cytidine 5'-diphospho)-2-C-methyl-D-erythritol kinase [Ligilactobacillus sp. Marseille-Q7487]
MEILEKAPAKLNLSLDTPFRHQDGEPEWNMVMTAIDLADYVHIETLDNTSEIIVETDSGFLPDDQRNLAYQAAKTLQQDFNVKQGVRITITKKIPVSAGMGGGSSDAAAVLRGLNQLWQLNLSKEQLALLGLKIDSDVPFCVYSQTALVTGRGEKITPLKSLPALWFVIAKPKASVSTPSIIRQIDYNRIIHQDVDAVCQAILNGDIEKLTANMGNVLEPITSHKYPEILRIKNKMISFGAQAAQMSGSGPTVFGVCTKYSRAQHVYNALRGFCQEVYLVCPFSLH